MLKILPVDEFNCHALVELSRLFKDVNFKIYKSSDSEQFITCIFSVFQSNLDCTQSWESINSTVAVVGHEMMHSESGPWNLYLIILTPDTLPKALKYKIENDRFAARKITFSLADLSLESSDPYNSIIDNLILGADLELYQENPDRKNYIISDNSKIKHFLIENEIEIPQDRKPNSRLIRKNFINQLLDLTTPP